MKSSNQTRSAATITHWPGKVRRLLPVVAVVVMLLIAAYVLLGPAIASRLLRRQLPRCNVILITLDTLRADRVSCYSDRYVNTPNIDSLARDGVLFETCISQTPLTLPAHTTILSGTYPLYHQVRDNGGFTVPGQLTLLSEVLKNNHFATAAFIGAFVLHSKWGLNRGFDLYADTFQDKSADKIISLDEIQKRAAEILGEASAWLSLNKDKKFFSWIHLYDAHAPYDPPSPFRGKYADRPYEGEVAYVDEELGKFFDFLKREKIWNKTLIIVTGDHGESLWEHREETHGFFVYDNTVRVPLIIKAPFSFPVHKITHIVQHVDLAPTILDALHLPVPASFQGKSLLNLMFSENSGWTDLAYSETFYPRLHYGWSELQVLYAGNWKYIRAPQAELYDLSADKGETKNQSLPKDWQKKKLRDSLDNFIREKSRNALSPLMSRNMDRETIKKLASLGYVATFFGSGGKETLADPKVKITVYNDLNDAKQLSIEKKYDEALTIVQKILAIDPNITDAYMFQGNLYYSKNLFSEAEKSFRQVLQYRPDYNFAMINVLNCLINQGQLDKALAACQEYIGIFPADSLFHYTMGDIYASKKDFGPALDWLFKAVKIEPRYGEAFIKIGEIYFLKRGYPQANENLKKALAIQPDIAKANYDLALIEEAQGNPEVAADFYRRELEIDPQNFKAAYNLAEILKKRGKGEEAIGFYRKAVSANPVFNIPYFMMAKLYLDNNENLSEAIGLCEKGISITPPDKYTVFGYFLLADIYALLGEKKKADSFYAKGKVLLQKTEKK